MSTKLLGVDIFRVSTVPLHELGLEANDVKGGEGVVSINEFLYPNTSGVYVPNTVVKVYDPHGVYRYVRANGANVAEGDAVTSDRAAGDLFIPHYIIETAAEAVIEGIAMQAIPLNSYGWIQVRGKHFNANVLDAVADDAFLESAAGGTLIAATNDVAYLQVTAHGCCVRKVCDRTAITGLTGADRGVVEIRS